MFIREIHDFYTNLIEDLDKEGKAALEVAKADLTRLGETVKASVTAEEQVLLQQYQAAAPEIQQALQVVIQSLEQAIIAALKQYGL